VSRVAPSPGKAIRDKCLFCMNFQPKEIKLCPSKKCDLFEFRLGKAKNKKTTACRAIKSYCAQCGESAKLCELEGCPIWPFRMGHNPNRTGLGNIEVLRRG